MATHNTCQNCQFWQKINDSMGACSYIPFEKELPQTGYNSAFISVGVADDSGLNARLITGHEFYCSHYRNSDPLLNQYAELVQRIQNHLRGGGHVLIGTALKSWEYSKPSQTDWFKIDAEGLPRVKQGKQWVIFAYCAIRFSDEMGNWVK